MIIYNVTVSIDKTVHDEWFRWMKEKHIPDVMNTGCFVEHRMCRVMNEEDAGLTYAMQYMCPDMETLQVYYKDHAPALQKEYNDRFRDKYAAFRTLLEVV